MEKVSIVGNNNITHSVLNSTNSSVGEVDNSNLIIAIDNNPMQHLTTTIEVKGHYNFTPHFALVRRNYPIWWKNPAGQGIHNVIPFGYKTLWNEDGSLEPLPKYYYGPFYLGGDPAKFYDSSWESQYSSLSRTRYDISGMDTTLGRKNIYDFIDDKHDGFWPYGCGPHQNMGSALQIVGTSKLEPGCYTRTVVPKFCGLVYEQFVRTLSLTGLKNIHAAGAPNDVPGLGDEIDRIHNAQLSSATPNYAYKFTKPTLADMSLGLWSLPPVHTLHDEYGAPVITSPWNLAVAYPPQLVVNALGMPVTADTVYDNNWTYRYRPSHLPDVATDGSAAWMTAPETWDQSTNWYSWADDPSNVDISNIWKVDTLLPQDKFGPSDKILTVFIDLFKTKFRDWAESQDSNLSISGDKWERFGELIAIKTWGAYAAWQFGVEQTYLVSDTSLCILDNSKDFRIITELAWDVSLLGYANEKFSNPNHMQKNMFGTGYETVFVHENTSKYTHPYVYKDVSFQEYKLTACYLDENAEGEKQWYLGGANPLNAWRHNNGTGHPFMTLDPSHIQTYGNFRESHDVLLTLTAGGGKAYAHANAKVEQYQSMASSVVANNRHMLLDGASSAAQADTSGIFVSPIQYS